MQRPAATTTKSLVLQTQILRELTSPESFQWNVRESYAKIAKKLGIDEETVRLAVKRANDSGFVEKWRFILNPNLLGETSASLQLDVENISAKKEIISQIKLIDGVFMIFDFHGKSLRVIFNFETNNSRTLDRKVALLCSICHSKESESLLWITRSPQCEVKPKRIDWQVLKAISKDPRRSLGDVASQLKVSSRTVNRRLKAMINGRMFYLIPVRNVKRSSGLLCNFVIRYTRNEVQSEIENVLEPLQERVDFVYKRKELYNVSMMLDNIRDADELEESFRRLSGVNDLRMNIVRDFIFVDEWLDDNIDRKLVSYDSSRN